MIHLKADTKEFTRKLKLIDRFYEDDYEDESLVKHPSAYTPKPSDPEISKMFACIENIDPMSTPLHRDNISYDERMALQDLDDLLKTDIIVKKADKGNTFVVMDVSYYRDKLVIADHLNSDTYAKADIDSDQKVMRDLRTLMEKHRLCLKDKEYDYVTDFEWKSSNLYVLPKIHKSKVIIDAIEKNNSSYLHIPIPVDLKGRPVIAGPAALHNTLVNY